MNIKFLIPIPPSELERKLLNLPLFLYRDNDWTEWASRTYGKPQIVLRHHDSKFKDKSEDEVIKDVSPLQDKLSMDELYLLRRRYRQAGEYTHPLGSVDIRIHQIFRQNENYRYQNRTSFDMELSALAEALRNQAIQPIPQEFLKEGEHSILKLSLHFDLGIISRDDIFDSMINFMQILRNDIVAYNYARRFVQQLKSNGIQFYAFSNSKVYFVIDLLAEHKSQEGSYVLYPQNLNLLQRGLLA